MSSLIRINASSGGRRAHLLARTALCGALLGFHCLAPTIATAAPIGGLAEVNAGGGNPVITTSGLRTDVTLNAPRTVLTWTAFDVTPDETVSFKFGARNWIVLNRIAGLSGSKIEGTVEGRVGGGYGGNVWFVSNSSLIFGKTARIDVGSLLVGIGNANTTTFLDPANNLFSFDGGDVVSGARLFVLSGAEITAHGGSATFAGPTVVTRSGAAITAADGSVTYGSAKNYQIRFAPGVGGDFDLVDFIVPDVASGADGALALDLAADTRANAVFVAAVNRSAVGTAVINLEGMITATAAKADGGDIVLSGGGGIANRAPAPSLSGAGLTDMFMNRATASRDLRVNNVGRIFPRPWLRPAEEEKNPTSLAEDADGGAGCVDVRGDLICPGDDDPDSGGNGGNGGGNGNGFCPPDCFGPLDSVVLDRALLSSLLDPTAISQVSAGRDTRIAATASIELGRIVSGRDVDVQGATLRGNGIVASGLLTLGATEGDVVLAGVGAVRGGSITASADARIDAITAMQKLTVTSGRDISLGDGTSSVAGAIALNAPNNVFLDVGSAQLESITAGASVNLRGGALDVGAVTAPKVFAQASSVKLGSVSTSGDLYVVASNGDAIVGSATAGDDIFVLATHGTASLGSGTLTGNSPDSVGLEFVGNPDTAGNGRVVRVESSDFDAKLGLGTGGVTGATVVTVRGGRDASVDVTRETPGAVSVVAVRDATLRAPTVRLDSVTAGRDLTVGSTTGDFTLTNTLSAVRNITVSAAGALRVGDVRADAGSVTLTGGTIQAGNVSASEDLILRATSGGVTTASYRTGRDLILQGTTLSLGATIAPVVRDLTITSLGNFTSGGPLSAGRNVTIDVAGKATLGQTAAAGVVRIAASDLDLTGTVTAPTVQIESRGGALRVGGTAGGAAGFVLDNNDFGQLRASGQVKIYAGLTTGGARGDLTVQDLTVNTANTPNVNLLVASSNNALVTGVAAPTANGGILRIGDATDLSWRPNSILVTGGLGAATFANGQYSNIRAFNEVRLAARQDILMGSQRFITLIQGTAPENIDLARLMPAGVAPQGDELLKVYVSAGRLEVSADNKVVQQNAAPSGSQQSVGLLFTGQFSPALIIDPPKVVELWGAFAGTNGQVLTGAQANGALTFTVVDAGGQPITKPDGANYRFNSCDVGTSNCAPIGGLNDGLGGDGGTGGGVGSGSADSGLRIRDSVGDGDDLSDQSLAEAVSSESLTSPPVLLGVAPPESDEIVTDPVMAGTGSEEIWRKRRQKK